MIVSFIIPIFKVEQYLVECVSSITSQSYRDIEVILVDDGSPDNSPAICDKLAEDDDRIIVIHKENGGLSDARNTGLQKATGDYVVFVDGDDFWSDSTCLERLIQVVNNNKNCDFIGFNCQYYYPDSNSRIQWDPFPKTITSDAIDNNTAIIELAKAGIFSVSACLKMIKREFLIKNELFFVKGQLAEDIPWFINLLDKAEKCLFVNHFIYNYRQNVVGSITNSGNKRSFENLLNIITTELSKVNDRSFNEDGRKSLMSFLAYEYCILLSSRSLDKKYRQELRKYRFLLNYDTNPKVRKASIINRFLGYDISVFVLRTYMYVHRSKK